MIFSELISKIPDSEFSNLLLRLFGKIANLTSGNGREMSKMLTSGTQFFSVGGERPATGSNGGQCCDCKRGGKERVIAHNLMLFVLVISAIVVIQLEGKSV